MSTTLGTADQHQWDVFICHASEDKESFVRPLVDALLDLGVRTWFDTFELSVGDSLSQSIDRGLATSRFGVVVLSKAFFGKGWPERELSGLVSREVGRDKVILPIWYGVTRDDVLSYSPTLADRYALDASQLDLRGIVLGIVKVARPDVFEHLKRVIMLRWLIASGERRNVSLDELRMSPIRRKVLSNEMLVRIKLVHLALGDLLSATYDDFVESFLRDSQLTAEIVIWERIAAAYTVAVRSRELTPEQRRDTLGVLLNKSFGPTASSFTPKHLADEFTNYLHKLYFTVAPMPDGLGSSPHPDSIVQHGEAVPLPTPEADEGKVP